MKIIRESIEFKRDSSDNDIRRKLRGDKFLPGEIVVRNNENYGGKGKNLYIFLERDPEKGSFGNRVYGFGGIICYRSWPSEYASFIHNTNIDSIFYIKDNTFRKANEKERDMIQQALDSGKYDRYIDKAKEITGITPFV
jgi:hypothetical protein